MQSSEISRLSDESLNLSHKLPKSLHKLTSPIASARLEGMKIFSDRSSFVPFAQAERDMKNNPAGGPSMSPSLRKKNYESKTRKRIQITRLNLDQKSTYAVNVRKLVFL